MFYDTIKSMYLGASLMDILFWTYGKGANEFLLLWMNIHWFLYHFFSVPQMLSSLFSPLKRLKDSRGRSFDPQKAMESFILNAVMRITGFLVRLTLLITAVFAQIGVVFAGGVFFALFLLWPFAAAMSFYYGFLFILT
ncbi:hypothetical protein A2924_02740 [Candidatus Giovannonibacteria bacterium RIFCSPLOWO2_01_FULL_44_16]|uniref:Uncharacterized protein n=2 Tax=Candidatus Giovannoniibacteriota TaxID=1752738 RepID=A0A1F5X5Q8_9BACT|nr:MAG: hypothetical protein A2924_02740 [Candidatus Giovannonibacteria bacterium RIFCSPLOWO2_01_FULL_44_16]